MSPFRKGRLKRGPLTVSWSPFEYLTDIFPAEGNGLLAVARERVVRLVPGESPGRFSLRETNMSNARVLACSGFPAAER